MEQKTYLPIVASVFITTLVVLLALFLVNSQKNQPQLSQATPGSQIWQNPQAGVKQPEVYQANQLGVCEATFNLVATASATPIALACASSGCSTDNDCTGDLVCTTANNGTKYCSMSSYVSACQTNPTYNNCCLAPYSTPTPTPAPLSCGYSPCSNDNDCTGDLVCITADNGSKYCSMSSYASACKTNPTFSKCCLAPTSAPTPTAPPAPELPAAGNLSPTLLFTLGGIVLVALGLLF